MCNWVDCPQAYGGDCLWNAHGGDPEECPHNVKAERPEETKRLEEHEA